MLKTLDPVLSADLLWILAAMGHGDDLALVDANHPAETIARATTSGRMGLIAVFHFVPLRNSSSRASGHRQVLKTRSLGGLVEPARNDGHQRLACS